MKPLIAIAGPSGAGKSSVAKALSRRLGIRTVDTGQIFRQMAKERGMGVIEFGEYVEKHKEIDIELDRRLAERMKRTRKGLILQGRLAAWTCLKYDIPAKKFWVTASTPVRVKRTMMREGGNYRDIMKDIIKRDRDNRVRYLATYGLDLNNTKVYDSVVNTDGLTIPQVVAAIIRKLPKVWLKNLPPTTKRSLKK
jgi:predicted cytidylate kinase